MARYCAAGLLVCVGVFAIAVGAQQVRSANDGVYTAEQAGRGQTVYLERCATCHGATLQGGSAPPLAGSEFNRVWGSQPLSDLANKIQVTMPANEPGKLTRQEAAAVVSHLLQVGKFPAGRNELGSDEAALKQITFPASADGLSKPMAGTAAQALAGPPLGNLAQLMRGIFFPSSNLIFNVQGYDPAQPKPAYQPGSSAFNWADWGAGIYSGWDLVDYAAVSLTDASPLLLVPRRCENGKPAPVQRADWVKFTQELADAGRAVYKASQSRNQEAVSDATNQLADSCLNCHVAYRDKPGGKAGDPSNKAGRCVP